MTSNYISGIWNGQLIENEEVVHTVQWTLTFTPTSSYPSCFGASLKTNKSNILHGKWSEAAKTIHIIEMDGSNNKIEYSGFILQQKHENEGSVWIVEGNWRNMNDTKEGKFLIIKEETSEGNETNTSGLWLGIANPDISLEDFYIPINPIHWCLSILKVNAKGDNIVFGSGFFNDSADVPNQPVIFYTLDGVYNMEKNELKINKIYEVAKQTEGYVIKYKGKLFEMEKDHWIEGTWKNKKGGSFGNFKCKKQPTTTTLTSHIIVCKLCSKMIFPGATRWFEPSKMHSFDVYCENCYISNDIDNKEQLKPEIIVDMPIAESPCSSQLIHNAFNLFSDFIFLRYHSFENQDRIETMTYGQTYEYVTKFFYGFRAICQELAVYDANLPNRPLVAFCDDLSVIYIVAMLGCLLDNCVLVPMHPGDEQATAQIFENSRPSVCFVGKKYKEHILNNIKRKFLPNLLIIENDYQVLAYDDSIPSGHPLENKERDHLTTRDLHSLGVRHINANNIQGIPKEHIKSKQRHETTAILYTSGSTGIPKGGVFNEDLILPTEGITTVLPYIRIDFQYFDPSLILSVLSTIQLGGSRLISNIEQMSKDIEQQKPTHLGASPIFWNNIYQDYIFEYNRLTEHYKKLNCQLPASDLEEKTVRIIKNKLGNRLYVATTGGAGISEKILNFIKEKLGVDLVNLYGTRETGGISRNGFLYENVDIKILPIDHYSFTESKDEINDSDLNEINHKEIGEICISSGRLISNYYNRDELNKKLFIKINNEKYYKTGDIGRLTVITHKKTGKVERKLEIIDRKSNIYKLSTGEWIFPSKLELIFQQSSWIEECFVGIRTQYNYTVIIITPSPLFRSLFSNLSLHDRKNKLIQEIRFYAKINKLRSFEIPKNIHIEEVIEWRIDNEFLTSTQKKKRSKFESHYTEIISQLFDETPITQSDSDKNAPDSLDPVKKSVNFSQEFIDILENLIPSYNKMLIDEKTNFYDLSGDSLTTIRFLNLLKNINSNINLHMIQNFPLVYLNYLISSENFYFPEKVQKNFSITEEEWKLENYISLEKYKNSKKLENNPNIQNIMITGCTGFLGPLLLSEIVKNHFPGAKQAAQSPKIFCVLRGNSKRECFEKLKANLIQAKCWEENPLINEAFHRKVIKIIPGDLSKKRLGLDKAHWEKLLYRSNIKIIYHSGAWVNMSVPFHILKQTNVLGTVEILKIAAANQSSFNYISTASTLSSEVVDDPSEPDARSKETFLPFIEPFSPNSQASLHRAGLEEIYEYLRNKSPYVQTKIISEYLIYQSSRAFQFPFRIFRPGNISGDRCTGFSNFYDFTNLLLFTCISLRSYVPNSTMHLAWTPVDFVANSITLIANSDGTENQFFHFYNRSPSLASVLSCLTARGFTLNPVTPSDWEFLVSRIPDTHKVAPLRSVLASLDWYSTSLDISVTNCKSFLSKSNIEWATVDEKLINIYIDNFISHKIDLAKMGFLI